MQGGCDHVLLCGYIPLWKQQESKDLSSIYYHVHGVPRGSEKSHILSEHLLRECMGFVF